MTNDPIIKIEQLEKSFGDLHVLKGIDLEVNRGEVVCIIGASGSGKSTLLRCINLLEEADSGHIWFDGQDLMDLKVNLNALRQKIGMVFQGFNLFNNKSVLDNCTLAPMDVKHIPKSQAEATAIKNRLKIMKHIFFKLWTGKHALMLCIKVNHNLIHTNLLVNS